MKTDLRTHVYQDNPDLPGTCLHCGVPDPKRTNRRHQLPDLSRETEEHRRRAGESEYE